LKYNYWLPNCYVLWVIRWLCIPCLVSSTKWVH